jgi:1-acyl-sn-glycerol-3-phosphate acyltransferase
MKTFRASLKMAGFVIAILVLVPPQIIFLIFHRGKYAYIIPRLWHRALSAILNIQIEMRGAPDFKTQTLYVCNHLSYLDIVALGGVIKRASFLAKSDVKSWPLFGFLAGLQRTAYIDRKRTSIGAAKTDLEIFLAEGHSLIFFPEGTSTSGVIVKPFKSSLFALALQGDRSIRIQPVTIAIAAVDGRAPQNIDDNNIYAWPLEMETSLGAHLWGFARSKGVRLILTFHAPIIAAPGDDRKLLAKTCEDSVSKGLGTALMAAE